MHCLKTHDEIDLQLHEGEVLGEKAGGLGQQLLSLRDSIARLQPIDGHGGSVADATIVGLQILAGKNRMRKM